MTKSKDNLNWFEEWFNSPYYHILYKNRDLDEAELFISNLLNYLNPAPDQQLLDVACGQGRHAITMNNMGFKVDAFDLSENSIKKARQFENNNLHFYVNDIRTPLKTNFYDFAFNLFTSFGYFDDDNDHLKAIQAIAKSMKTNGTFVLDFMNVSKVINELIHEEVKIIEGIEFRISKEIVDNFIVKTIRLKDQDKVLCFQERVKVITLSDFIRYFKAANLKIEATFGDYKLTPFDENTSQRLILIAKINEQ